jgi:hypothetical protein
MFTRAPHLHAVCSGPTPLQSPISISGAIPGLAGYTGDTWHQRRVARTERAAQLDGDCRGSVRRHLTRIRAATGSLCSTSSYPLCILNSVQVIHTYTTPLLWTTSHNVNHHASSKLIADAEHEERHRNTQITGVIRTSSLWFLHSSGHASCGPWAFKHPIVSGAFTPAGLSLSTKGLRSTCPP